MDRIPKLTATKKLLTGALDLQNWERAGDSKRWVARSRSGLVAVEIVGDPIQQMSLVVPIRKGAGTIVGQFLNQFAPDARQKIATVMAYWGETRLKKPLDSTFSTPGALWSVRIQSMLDTMILVTVMR